MKKKDQAFDFYASAEEVTLPNGLTVVAAHRPKAQWENILFGLRSGGKDDPVGLEGLAHFLEHQIVEEFYLSYQERIDYFMSLGGDFSIGSTSMLGTFWRCMVPKKNFGESIDFFSRLLFDPAFTQIEKLQRERATVVQELAKAKGPSILDKLYGLFNPLPLVFSRHPFGAIGTLDGINSITMADLAEFHRKHYRPENFIVVAEGGLSVKKVVNLLQNSRFGEIRENPWQNPLVPQNVTLNKPCVRLIEDGLGEFGDKYDGAVTCEIFCLAPPDMNLQMKVAKHILNSAVCKYAFNRLRLEKNLIYDSSQGFAVEPFKADQYHFSVRLERRADVRSVVTMWDDFLAWLQSSEFESFFKRKIECHYVQEKYFDDDQVANTSLENAFFHCLKSVPYDCLTVEAQQAQWKNCTLDDIRHYIKYLREYVVIVRKV